MATLAVSTELPSHIVRFESKIRDAQQSTAALSGDPFFTQLFKIIHQPGWTTPAESIFFETLLDATITTAQHLGQLQKQLLAGAQAVGRQ